MNRVVRHALYATNGGKLDVRMEIEQAGLAPVAMSSLVDVPVVQRFQTRSD